MKLCGCTKPPSFARFRERPAVSVSLSCCGHRHNSPNPPLHCPWATFTQPADAHVYFFFLLCSALSQTRQTDASIGCRGLAGSSARSRFINFARMRAATSCPITKAARGGRRPFWPQSAGQSTRPGPAAAVHLQFTQPKCSRPASSGPSRPRMPAVCPAPPYG